MTVPEPLARFTECSQQQGFSEHVDPFYEKQQNGQWLRALPVSGKHLNPEGVVHGGVLLTFADYVIYRAIGDERGHQQQFATINLNTQFLAAAKQSQIIYGDGRVVRNTRSVIFAEGRLWTDERKVMTATGIWKIIGA